MSMKVTAKDLKSQKDVEIIDVVRENDKYIVTASTSESLVDVLSHDRSEYEFEATVNSVFNAEIDESLIKDGSIEMSSRDLEFLTIDSLTRITTNYGDSSYDELNYALAEMLKKREASQFVYHFDFEEEDD